MNYFMLHEPLLKKLTGHGSLSVTSVTCTLGIVGLLKVAHIQLATVISSVSVNPLPAAGVKNPNECSLLHV